MATPAISTHENEPSPGRVRPRLIDTALAFALGVALFHWPAAQPPAAVTAVAAGVALLVGWRWPAWRPYGAIAIGFLYAQIHACPLLCQPFPEAASRTDILIEGTIASLPTDTDLGRRFLFRVDRARWVARAAGDRLPFSGLVRLTWYRDPPPLRVGERWHLAARLIPPHGYANPGGFDYELWLFGQGIKATGYVRDDRGNRRLAATGGLGFAVARWRQALRDHLDRQLEAGTTRALVQALVLGETGGLTPPQWEVLTRTGTSHLIAISGMNVGLVAGAAFKLGQWLWSRSARLSLMLAAPRAATLAAAAAALGYSALAGFAIPTQRALIMLAVVLASLFWGRTLRPFRALAIALAGVLLIDPRSVLSYGFWLSFAAVAVLLFALGQRWRATGLWWRWGRPQWAVALGLLPLLLPFFGRASLVAPPVNLLAVPLFGLLLPVLLAATLLSLVPGFGLPLTLVAEVLGWGFGLLERVADHPWAATTIAWRPLWAWLAAGVGALLWLAPRGLPGRALAIVWLLPVLVIRPPVPPPGAAWITVLDVGQGLAVVVRTHGHTLLYDTGPGFPSGFNAGSTVILPFLRHAGIDRIDTLIVSHADNDHAGGLASLIGALPIGRVLSGEPARLKGIAAAPCRAGISWRWDGVEMRLLHPDRPGYRGNDASCVLHITGGGTSLLLTGDIGRRIEQRLVAQHGSDLRADLLVAAHHGSDTSSSAPFLAAVAPRFVLYTSGFANRYGFPAPTVRTRVAATGAQALDTSTGGAIQLRLGADGKLTGPWQHRHEAPRLWTHRPAQTAGNGPR